MPRLIFLGEEEIHGHIHVKLVKERARTGSNITVRTFHIWREKIKEKAVTNSTEDSESSLSMLSCEESTFCKMVILNPLSSRSNNPMPSGVAQILDPKVHIPLLCLQRVQVTIYLSRMMMIMTLVLKTSSLVKSEK